MEGDGVCGVVYFFSNKMQVCHTVTSAATGRISCAATPNRGPPGAWWKGVRKETGFCGVVYFFSNKIQVCHTVTSEAVGESAAQRWRGRGGASLCDRTDRLSAGTC